LKRFHQNDLRQWYRLLLRSSGFLNLGLHERIGLTLLELSSDFRVKESRGTLLRPSFSHQDIADLVGASRPRVTEHLAKLEREHVVIRQGRQLIVRVDKIGVPDASIYKTSLQPHSREEQLSIASDEMEKRGAENPLASS
jgi:DNA-binding Lrp family transcriptional regulator